MEELTLRRYVYMEVMSVDLTKVSDRDGTHYEVTVNTLDDNQEEDKLVYEFKSLILQDVIEVFNTKVSLMSGLVS